MGQYLMEKLNGLKEKYPFIVEVRGKGLMVGMEFSIPKANDIKKQCLKAGYLVGAVGDNIIRMLPPLIVSKEDIDGLVNAYDQIFSRLQ